MVWNTQCWNWQKIKGNRDVKCAVKLGTAKYHGWLESEPSRAGLLNREIWGARGPKTGSEQTVQEKFKELGEL